MPLAEINGASLYYEVVGEGYPLVLIHAGIADHRLWKNQIDEFSKRYKMIRYDLRGFGDSNFPDGEFSHYRDLYGLLQFLNIEKAHLCGVSMGGSTAVDLALAYPQMVSALITCGSGASGFQREMSDEEKKYWEDFETKWDGFFKAGKLEEANEMEVELWVDGPRSPSEVNPEVRALVGAMNLKAMRKYNENAKFVRLEPPAAGRLAEINVPTLVLIGDLDTAGAIASSNYLAANIPNARKVVLYGLTHVPNLERPQEYNRLVLDFLDGVH